MINAILKANQFLLEKQVGVHGFKGSGVYVRGLSPSGRDMVV